MYVHHNVAYTVWTKSEGGPWYSLEHIKKTISISDIGISRLDEPRAIPKKHLEHYLIQKKKWYCLKQVIQKSMESCKKKIKRQNIAHA